MVWPDTSLELPRTFTVHAGTIGPRLEAHIEVPPVARYDRPSTLWLEYANTGDADMLAPLLTVSIEDQPAVMRLKPGPPMANPHDKGAGPES